METTWHGLLCMLGTGQTFVTGRKPSSYVLVGNLRKPHSPLLDLLEYLGKTQYVYIVLVISSFSYFYRFSNLFIYVYIYIYETLFLRQRCMLQILGVFFLQPQVVGLWRIDLQLMSGWCGPRKVDTSQWCAVIAGCRCFVEHGSRSKKKATCSSTVPQIPKWIIICQWSTPPI